MLLKLSQQARQCYEHAERCRQRADAAADPEVRADYLDFEARWLFMAEVYQLSLRLTDFTRRFRHDGSTESASHRLDQDEEPARSCPRCRSQMEQVASIPRLGPHPELLTFKCGTCGYVETIEYRARSRGNRASPPQV